VTLLCPENSLKSKAAHAHANTTIRDKVEKGQVRLNLEGKTEQALEADCALVAIGVRPIVPSGLSIALDKKGFISVDDRYQTNVPGVFAAGDVIGPPRLAHVASWEAIQAVEGIFIEGFQPQRMKEFPGCTYSQPQVVSIGLTEKAAKEQGLAF
jgi:dihydrolipoamide dehydrogenase